MIKVKILKDISIGYYIDDIVELEDKMAILLVETGEAEYCSDYEVAIVQPPEKAISEHRKPRVINLTLRQH